MDRLLVVGGLFLAALALGTPAGAQIAADDPFLAGHASHVAANLPSPRLELRLKDGRFRFDPREPIEVDALFEVGAAGALDPSLGSWGCPNEWDTQIVFDRPTDVSFPGTALCHDFGLVSPGVTCCGGSGAAGPRTKTLLLNGLARFTSAGRHRLFVRSRLRGGPSGPPRFQTSNILTLEIARREDGWAAAALDAAVAVIDTRKTDAEVSGAFETLGRLASPAAAAAIASRFDRSRSARQALFAIPQRSVAVAAVEEQLRRAGAPVSGALVRTAALLALVARHSEPPYPHDAYLSLVEHYSQVRILAVQTVPGGLKAAIRAELSEAAADEKRLLVGPLSAAFHHAPEETAAVFEQLETRQRARLLRLNWRRFAHPSFLPMVRRAAGVAYDPELVDIALRRLFQLSPSEGRAAILTELARPDSRISIETVRGLPDAAQPALESSWVRILETSVASEAILRAAFRLERFGTQASASGVERAWRTRHADWPLDADPPVIAFLARVAPAAATGVLQEALAEPDEAGGVGRDEPLLVAVGRLHWSAGIETAAVAALADRRAATAAGGAEALRRFGSVSARKAIEDALVRVRPAVLDEPADSRRAGDTEWLEGRFATALNHALRWTLSERVRGLWRRGCIRSACTDALADPRHDTDPPWHVQVYRLSDDAGVGFGVGELHVASVDALVEKLRYFPRGTRVHLGLPWPNQRGAVGHSHEFFTEQDVAALFETVRSRAAAVGIEIVRDVLDGR